MAVALGMRCGDGWPLAGLASKVTLRHLAPSGEFCSHMNGARSVVGIEGRLYFASIRWLTATQVMVARASEAAACNMLLAGGRGRALALLSAKRIDPTGRTRLTATARAHIPHTTRVPNCSAPSFLSLGGGSLSP